MIDLRSPDVDESPEGTVHAVNEALAEFMGRMADDVDLAEIERRVRAILPCVESVELDERRGQIVILARWYDGRSMEFRSGVA